VDSFQEIAATGSAGIDTFTATDKSGTKYIYGRFGGLSDGFQKGGGETGDVAYKYALKRVEDPIGNYVSYTYLDLGDGEYVLSQIDYTGGSGIEPQVRVEFSYANNPDQSVDYIAGRRFRVEARLETITSKSQVSSNFVTTSSYVLNYDHSAALSRSRLTSITPSWADPVSETLQAGTAFSINWGSAPVSMTPPVPSGYGPGGVTESAWQGDFNGDGRSDVLFRQGTDYKIGYQNVAGEWQTITSPVGPLPPGITQLVTMRLVTTGDFNGDGRTDLVWVMPNSPSNGGGWYVSLSTGTGFAPMQLISSNNSNWLTENKCVPASALVLDTDGDGLDELLFQVYIQISTHNLGGMLGGLAGANGGFDVYDAMESMLGGARVSSVNVILPSGPIYLVRPSLVNGVLVFTESILPNLPNLATASPISLRRTDLDGDGRSDLIATVLDIGNPGFIGGAEVGWRSHSLLNNGNGGFTLIQTLAEHGGIVGGSAGSNGYATLAGDVNGDGIDDMVFLKKYYPGGLYEGEQSGWFVALSKGNGQFDLSAFTGIPQDVTINGAAVPTYHQRSGFVAIGYVSGDTESYSFVESYEGYDICGVLLLDYNGDGRKDFVWYSAESGWRCFLAGSSGFDTSNAIAAFGSQSDTMNYIWNGDFFSDVHAVDTRGDGQDNLLLVCRTLPGPGATGVTLALNPFGNPYRLTGTVDGLGARTELEYASVANDALYTPGGAVSYPIKENRRQVVVSDVYRDNGGNFASGERQHFSYQYSGNRMDLSGRGALGFHSFVTLDHQTNLFKYQFLAQSFPMTGLTHREETYRYLGGTSFNIISSHDNTVVFDKVATGGGATLWPFISKAIEYRWEDGAKTFTATGGPSAQAEGLFGVTDRTGSHITITAESRFDNQGSPQLTLPSVSGYNPSDFNGTANTVAGTTTYATFSGLPGAITYGNLKQLATDFGGGFTETVVTTYKPPAGALTGLVDTVTATVTSPAYGTESAPVKRYTYWGSTPLVETDTIDATNSALDLKTTYTRDSRGRVTNTQIENTAATGQQAIGSYSISSVPSGAFDNRWDLPTTSRNAEPYLHSTTAAYHPFLGLPTSVTDVNGAQVTTQYDPLGRATVVTDILKGLVRTTNFAWDTSQVVSPPSGVNGLTLTSAYAVTTVVTVQPTVTSYHDRLGRAIRTSKSGFGGQQVFTDTVYDALGRVAAVSHPYPSGGTKYWTKTTYDLLGRVSTVTAPNGTVTTNAYVGRATKVTVDAPSLGGVDPAPQVNATVVDAKGRTVKVWNADNVPTFSDNAGTTGTAPSIAFALDGFGRMRSTTLKGQESQPVTATYDALGRQTQLADPDKGPWSYLNNALGQVVSQVDARGNTTASTFDRLGRPLSRSTTGNGSTETASFHYYDTGSLSGKPNTVAKGDKGWIGAPQREEASASGSYATTNLHYYDDKGRPQLELAQIDGKWFYTHTAYDAYSRPQAIRHYWRPSGAELPAQQPYVWQDFGYTYAYDSRSYVIGLTDSLGRSWWDNPVYDRLDRVTSVRKGSGHTTTRTYRFTDGVQTAIHTGAGAIQNLYFDYDGLGNLTSRFSGSLSETYGYDSLNRLTTRNGNTIATYAPNGNILSKTGVTGAASGTYGYTVSQPHAVTSAWGYGMTYDGNGNLLTRSKAGESWSLQWAGFDKPRWMAKTTGSTTAGSEFHYNAARSRVMQLEFDAMSGGVPSHYTRKRLYALGSTLELNYDNTAASGAPAWSMKKVRIYVPGPDGVIGAREFDVTGVPGMGAEKTLVYHYDHLGSITAITDFGSVAASYSLASGNKSGRYSEDAWGQRRDPLDWSGAPTATTDDGGFDSLTPRGFTGHEMLDDLGLVHMNGRIYDPLLGRFLSADIVVQAPGSLQSYNRYSYVMNNPLSLTDPSGFFWDPNTGFWGASAWATFGREVGSQYIGIGERVNAGAAEVGYVAADMAMMRADLVQTGEIDLNREVFSATFKDSNRATIGFAGVDFDAKAVLGTTEMTATVGTLGGYNAVKGGVNMAQGDFAGAQDNFVTSVLVGSSAVPSTRLGGRLPQDAGVNPAAPDPKPTTRPVGGTPAQNRLAQADIQELRNSGHVDIRVTQHQTNASGERVGRNLPDVQSSQPRAIGRDRATIEYEQPGAPRGQDHVNRTLNNDPRATVTVKEVNPATGSVTRQSTHNTHSNTPVAQPSEEEKRRRAGGGR